MSVASFRKAVGWASKTNLQATAAGNCNGSNAKMSNKHEDPERKWWFLHMAMCYSDKSVFHLVSNNRSSGRPDRHPKAKQFYPLSSVQTIVIFFIFLVPRDPIEWHTNQPTNNIWQQIFFLVCNGVVDCPPSKTGLGGEDEENCKEGEEAS